MGSTYEIDVGPTTDFGDVTGPTTDVGNALRATGHTTDTVDFVWPLAPLAAAGESYVILRSDGNPQGPFDLRATTGVQAWTDPSAPPRYSPVHVWFYDVRLADACFNLSQD